MVSLVSSMGDNVEDGKVGDDKLISIAMEAGFGCSMIPHIMPIEWGCHKTSCNTTIPLHIWIMKNP